MSARTRVSPPVLLSSALLLTLLGQGCGATVYQPGRGMKFDINAAMQINDDDIRKAFASRPQMGSSIRVAYYSFDPSRVDELEKMLRAREGVSDVYRIPTVMVTGRRRFDRQPSPHHTPQPARPMSVKQLRMLAARAHCDVVVVFDYAHRIETSANGWAALNVLLLPLLFAPYLDKKVDSYLESFIVDTRNGYLYGHITTKQQGQARRVTIYTQQHDELVKKHWGRLLGETGKALASLIAGNRAASAERGASSAERKLKPGIVAPSANNGAGTKGP